MNEKLKALLVALWAFVMETAFNHEYGEHNTTDALKLANAINAVLGEGEEGQARPSLAEIVAQLEACGYRCEAGPLELNTAFIALKQRAELEKQSGL